MHSSETQNPVVGGAPAYRPPHRRLGARLVELIDQACLERRNEERERDNRFPISGSSMASCPRKLAKLLMGEADEFSPESLRTFQAGHDRQRDLALLIQRQLLKTGAKFEMFFEPEVWSVIGVADPIDREPLTRLLASDTPLPIRIFDDGRLWIRSHPDLVVLEHGDGGKHVTNIDIKTAKDYAFDMVEKEGPSMDYLCQLRAQGLGVQNWLGLHPVSLVLLYENKNDNKLRPLEIEGEHLEAAGEAYERAANRITRLLSQWVRGELDQSQALFAEQGFWTKKAHVAALGCLPWQCNYCSVGPIRGNCLPGRELKDIGKDGKVKWEILS